jgi:hypothetical protein
MTGACFVFSSASYRRLQELEEFGEHVLAGDVAMQPGRLRAGTTLQPECTSDQAPVTYSSAEKVVSHRELASIQPA